MRRVQPRVRRRRSISIHIELWGRGMICARLRLSSRSCRCTTIACIPRYIRASGARDVCAFKLQMDRSPSIEPAKVHEQIDLRMKKVRPGPNVSRALKARGQKSTYDIDPGMRRIAPG